MAANANKLNGRVAAQIMGWTEWTDLRGDCPSEPGVTYFADWGDNHGLAVYLPTDATGDVSFYFNPALDRADAQKVIEMVREWPERERYSFTMRLHWAVEDRLARNVTDRQIILYVEPFDICNAALKVVEQGVTPV